MTIRERSAIQIHYLRRTRSQATSVSKRSIQQFGDDVHYPCKDMSFVSQLDLGCHSLKFAKFRNWHSAVLREVSQASRCAKRKTLILDPKPPIGRSSGSVANQTAVSVPSSREWLATAPHSPLGQKLGTLKLTLYTSITARLPGAIANLQQSENQ